MSCNSMIADQSKDKKAQMVAREAYVLGEQPRMEPLQLDAVSEELIDLIKRMLVVNRVFQSDEEEGRGDGLELQRLIDADPAVAAGSPEVLAHLNEIPEVMRTMLRHPELFIAHTDLGLQLLANRTLSFRDRELAVLRVAWLCQAPYEWGEHVLIARRLGFSEAEIESIIEGPATRGLDERDRAVISAVDELVSDAMISDPTWDTLSKYLDEKQLIELPVIIGHYQSVAYYQNSLRLRLHKGNLGLQAR